MNPRVLLIGLTALALLDAVHAQSISGPSLSQIAAELAQWLEGVQKIGFFLGMLTTAVGFIVKTLAKKVPGEVGARLDTMATGIIAAGAIAAIGVLAGPYFIKVLAEKFFGYSPTP